MTGLYIHVPFCARACPYCDFDFVVGRRPDVDGYVDALQREILARGLPGLAPTTVYLGGGTPSLLGPQGLARVLQLLRAHFDLGQVRETTVELNPEHVDEALLDALVEHGCDRVSIGAQTLTRTGLVQLGRVHDGVRARAAVADAVGKGLRVSADLIVGWPGQTKADLDSDLRALTGAGAQHLSIYALTIEPDTAWPGLVRRGMRQIPDEDAQADRLAEVAAWAAGAAWQHYEIASYAAATADRAQHNMGYWTAADYVGVGPSAASASYDATGAVTRRTNARGYAAWREDPGQAGAREHLTAHAAAVEGLWLGLRVLTGLCVASFVERFVAIDRAWIDARVEPLVRRGDLVWDGDLRLAVAPQRWLWHDAIAAELL